MLETDPIDLLLDDDTHDLVIRDGDFVFSSGLQGIAQAVKIAVMMIRGEWFYDLDEGVRYYERLDGSIPAREAILGQKFDELKAIADIRDAILSIPYEIKIVSIAATFDPDTRVLTMSWELQPTFGGTIADTLVRGV